MDRYVSYQISLIDNILKIQYDSKLGTKKSLLDMDVLIVWEIKNQFLEMPFYCYYYCCMTGKLSYL